MNRVAIIGAGLTGLSAGIVLQEHGIDTEIFDMAPWPGGVCTAWTRKGYTFDGCIHWMVGTRKGEPMRATYERVHALMPDTEIHHLDSIHLDIDGEIHVVPLQIDRFRAFLLEIAPEDEKAIRHMCRTIERVSRSEMVPGRPKSLKGFVHMMTKGRGFMVTLIKYMNRTVRAYCRRFTSDRVVSIIHHLMGPDMSAFALFMMLGMRMGQNGGFPMGGARDMIARMSERYLALGGTLTLNTRIDEIVVKEGAAVAVRSGERTYSTGHAIAACDMYDTLKRMLKGKYPHETLDRMLREAPLFDPIMLVSLGLNQRFDMPYDTLVPIPNPIDTGDSKTNRLYVRSFAFEPTFAPEGSMSIMVTLPAIFDYWQELRTNDLQAYRETKGRIARDVIAALEDVYPGLRESVEVIDVATPATYYRLNNLHRGSWEGFLPVPGSLRTVIEKSVSGISNLVLAGQWVTPGGGIPPAIMGGIDSAERIIRQMRKRKG
ncbi:MAG: phytoene desaturase family protein [Acholeplasmataceae bacterium]